MKRTLTLPRVREWGNTGTSDWDSPERLRVIESPSPGELAVFIALSFLTKKLIFLIFLAVVCRHEERLEERQIHSQTIAADLFNCPLYYLLHMFLVLKGQSAANFNDNNGDLTSHFG